MPTYLEDGRQCTLPRVIGTMRVEHLSLSLRIRLEIISDRIGQVDDARGAWRGHNIFPAGQMVHRRIQHTRQM